MIRPYLKFIIPIAIPLLVLLMPLSAFPFDGLTIIQQRVIAIFLLAALLWVFEPIPIYATSVVIIVLELMMLSDKGWCCSGSMNRHPNLAVCCTTATLWRPLPARSSCCFWGILFGDGSDEISS